MKKIPPNRRSIVKAILGGPVAIASAWLVPRRAFAGEEGEDQPMADCPCCCFTHGWSDCEMRDGKMRKTRIWYKCWLVGGYLSNPCGEDVCVCDEFGNCPQDW